MNSGEKSVLILLSAVSLCGVIACCESIMGGIYTPVPPAGSILMAGVGSVRGLEMQGMWREWVVRRCFL